MPLLACWTKVWQLDNSRAFRELDRIRGASRDADPATKTLALVELERVLMHRSCVELTALNTYPAIGARFVILLGDIFRCDNVVRYSKPYKSAKGMTTAGTAAADNSWFLFSLEDIGHVHQTGFVRPFERAERLSNRHLPSAALDCFFGILVKAYAHVQRCITFMEPEPAITIIDCNDAGIFENFLHVGKIDDRLRSFDGDIDWNRDRRHLVDIILHQFLLRPISGFISHAIPFQDELILTSLSLTLSDFMIGITRLPSWI
jgi:hypothetical protein